MANALKINIYCLGIGQCHIVCIFWRHAMCHSIFFGKLKRLDFWAGEKRTIRFVEVGLLASHCDLCIKKLPIERNEKKTAVIKLMCWKLKDSSPDKKMF